MNKVIERLQKTANLKSEANSPKRRLMDIEAQLREIGNSKAANSLNRIIARLEAWQNRN